MMRTVNVSERLAHALEIEREKAETLAAAGYRTPRVLRALNKGELTKLVGKATAEAIIERLSATGA